MNSSGSDFRLSLRENRSRRQPTRMAVAPTGMTNRPTPTKSVAGLFTLKTETGGTPTWDQPWTDLEMFYPGQVSWPRLTDPKQHPGADKIAARVPVSFRHKPAQLAQYGVEVEFADKIVRQWVLTLLASLGLIVALGININLLMTRKEA